MKFDRILGDPEISVEITIKITEDEAGLLNAIAGYGWDSFIHLFKAKMGKHYIEKYEHAGPELFYFLHQDLDNILTKMERARNSVILNYNGLSKCETCQKKGSCVYEKKD